MRQIKIATRADRRFGVQREAPVPVPPAGQALLRAAAAGVDSPDLIHRAGRHPAPADASPILGLEVAGEVVALGDGVTPLAIDDQVCALTNVGGYAEYCLAPASQTLPFPDGMDALHTAVLHETFFSVETQFRARPCWCMAGLLVSARRRCSSAASSASLPLQLPAATRNARQLPG